MKQPMKKVPPAIAANLPQGSMMGMPMVPKQATKQQVAPKPPARRPMGQRGR